MPDRPDARALILAGGLAALALLVALALAGRGWLAARARPAQPPAAAAPIAPGDAPAGALPGDGVVQHLDSARGPVPPPLASPRPATAPWLGAWAEYAAARGRIALRPAAEESLRALTRRLLVLRPPALRQTPPDTSRAARLAFLRRFYGAQLLRAMPQLEAAIQTRRAAAIIEREIELFNEPSLRR